MGFSFIYASLKHPELLPGVSLIYWSAQAFAGATVSSSFRLRGPPPSDPPLEPNVQIYVYVLFNLNM